MTDARLLVRDLYEAYQLRDWDAAAKLLHPDASVDMPATPGVTVGGEEPPPGRAQRY